MLIFKLVLLTFVMKKTIIITVATITVVGTALVAQQVTKSDENIHDDYSTEATNDDFNYSDEEDKTFDELDEGDKNVDEPVPDESIWEDEEEYDEDVPDLTAFDGFYTGIWSFSGKMFEAPITLNVKDGSFNESVTFERPVVDYASGTEGYSTTTIMFSGQIWEDGSIQGSLNGEGITQGIHLGSSTRINGTLSGTVIEKTMELWYEMTSNAMIPDYGQISSADSGIINLENVTYDIDRLN